MNQEPGIYPGVSQAVYTSWDARRSSVLKAAKTSAAHLRLASLNVEDKGTKATELGDAAHAAILEPDRFEKEYCAGLVGVGRQSKVDKGKHARHQLDNLGKTVLLQDDYEAALRMRDAAWAKPWAAELLGGKGLNEVSVVWDDPETGVRCKSRTDHLCPAYQFQDWPQPATVICELKTCLDPTPQGWEKQIGDYSYQLQATMQLESLEIHAPPRAQLIWIVFEKKAPFEVALYCPSDECLADGQIRLRHALALWAECSRSGHWPGFPNHPQMVDLKPWARMRRSDRDEFPEPRRSEP